MGLKVSHEITLPLDVAGEAIAILGKRGSGKTNTATVFVEELVRAGVQTVILDPVGAWWGLRSNAAGDGPGLEVPRLGGQHGDVPLEQTAGALIADVAIESRQSLLVDLSDFPTKAAVGRFVTDFAERLYRRKKADSVLHLVLEEADTFAPQKVKGSERMQGAIEQIVRRGRSRGMGVTLITQRSAVLSKDVLTQADVLIVMRTTGPHDLRAIREWIDSRGDEHGAGVLDSLPSLDTGEGWVWNPERDLIARTQFRARQTFDSSRTPKAGEVRVEPAAAAAIDLDSLGEQIRATAEKAKADDPSVLRRRINELERELKRQPEAPTPVVERVEVPVPVFNGEIEQLTRIAEQALAALPQFAETVEAAVAKVESVIAAASRLEGGHSAAVIPERPRATREAPRRPDRVERAARPSRAQSRPPREDANASGFTPTSSQQKIIDALAWLDSVGIEGERRRVGFLAGYSPNSGNFNNLLGQLRSAGILDYPRGGYVALTDAGAELAHPPQSAPTTVELHAKVLSKLKGPQQKVLVELFQAHPQALDRETLGDLTGYSPNSGNFNNILGSMRTLGLIDYPNPGYVRAEDVLFID